MKIVIVLNAFLCLLSFVGFSQIRQLIDSTNINNLELPVGYETATYGEMPHFTKSGSAGQAMIIIPGWGFDESVFADFINEHKKNYKIFSITIPGFGKTAAPPMPPTGTSYGNQYWNRGVIEGLLKLITDQQIDRPVIVGHFVQGTQLAMRMAIDYPQLVGGLILIGGPAKFIAIQDGEPKEFPLRGSIAYVDKYTGPEFFKPISRSAFDDGNYLPQLYSVNDMQARKLWKKSASVPLPVMIQYLCEFIASDLTLETEKIKCPVLVIRPHFTSELLSHKENPNLNYIKPQFIDAWDRLPKSNALIAIHDVYNSGVFTWKDRKLETNKVIKRFMNALKSKL
jgi:pimeloyl-ACP methyl ester carboxylesterase